MDPELKQFADDLIESTRQAQRGEAVRIHTALQIAARRGRLAALTQLPPEVHDEERNQDKPTET